MSDASVNNGTPNASLLSGMNQLAFHEQPVDGDDYDVAVNEMTAVANPEDAEAQLMNELMFAALDMKKITDDLRDYLISINASVEMVALLDKLRLRKGKQDGISECALKLLRLLHDPKHPLYGKRMRMFTTVTGYKKNWWKKAEVVKNMKEPDD